MHEPCGRSDFGRLVDFIHQVKSDTAQKKSEVRRILCEIFDQVIGYADGLRKPEMGYSADVDLWLTYGDERIDLRQVGPDFVITDQADRLVPGDVVMVFVSVDGRVLSHGGTVSRIDGKRVWIDQTTPTPS